MKSEWKNVSLNNMMSFKNGKKRPKQAGDIPVYGGNGILGFTNEFNSQNCIIIGRVGAYCGSVYREKEKCWISDNAICCIANEYSDVVFDYYLLRNLHLNQRHIGTSQPLLTQEILNRIEVSCPPLEQQREIGAFLTQLDDKIELNQRINDNLQQQLFLLYANLISTDVFSNYVELGTLCDFQEGYVNPSQTHPEYFDGDIKWLRAVDINESFIIHTSRTLTTSGFESAKKSAVLFKPKTLAISKSGTIGRLGIIGDYMCGNRAVINIVPKNKNHLPFIYGFLKSKQREFPDMAVGSVQKNLYVSLLEPLIVLLPASDRFYAFCEIGNSILNAIQCNCIQNVNLSSLRDTLLPKLMSGEIKVS